MFKVAAGRIVPTPLAGLDRVKMVQKLSNKFEIEIQL